MIEKVGQLPLEEPSTTGDYDEVSSTTAAWLHPRTGECDGSVDSRQMATGNTGEHYGMD
jgi:hypothetical protein